MKIVRKSQLNLNNLTTIKKLLIESMVLQYREAVNEYIKYYWPIEKYPISLLKKEHLSVVTSYLSERLKKRAAKQAIEICKSVKNKRLKNKSKSEKDLTCKVPELKELNVNLDKDFNPLREVLDESFYEDEDSSEDEGMPDYKIGGYHPIHVGEILLDRYVII
jgi:hypothetical protein